MTQPNQGELKCGHTAPDWNGEGDCITCARDRVLGASDLDRKIDEREKIADILRTGHHGIAETKVVNALLALINEARADNIKSLVTDMQMDMRLKFDAKHDDFQTFDGMCAFMNLWVAERIAELKGDK